eukprot:TRINITY_DN30428_c0_g2_i1.p1 TRINITY_DN30428_c0_g2~~TRINITY_DN30428_c0_g2_i1.p1  ORF type:complete len:138 (+),score=16.95 TRINITY_DN30428_c0_g2_i1:74-487(+)
MAEFGTRALSRSTSSSSLSSILPYPEDASTICSSPSIDTIDIKSAVLQNYEACDKINELDQAIWVDIIQGIKALAACFWGVSVANVPGELVNDLKKYRPFISGQVQAKRAKSKEDGGPLRRVPRVHDLAAIDNCRTR